MYPCRIGTRFLIFPFRLGIACGRKKNPNWNLLPLWSVKSCLNFKAGNMLLFCVTAGIQNQLWSVLTMPRIDSVMYDLAPARTGRRGRPAKHGKQLSVETNFTFSNEKIGDYYTGVRRVLTMILGSQEVLPYVTATEKEHGTKRLFFSTIFPEEQQIFCAW